MLTKELTEGTPQAFPTPRGLVLLQAPRDPSTEAMLLTGWWA